MSGNCWNCNSPKYVNVASYENCPDCGIYCDYRGSGPNDKYELAQERKEQIYIKSYYAGDYGYNPESRY